MCVLTVLSTMSMFHVCFCCVRIHTGNFASLDNVALAALILLPALLPDAHCKVDTAKVVYIAQVSVFVCMTN